MAEHGEHPDGTPAQHTPHGEHVDHDELARLHTIGWFLGHQDRTGHPHALARLRALLDGLYRGRVSRSEL